MKAVDVAEIPTEMGAGWKNTILAGLANYIDGGSIVDQFPTRPRGASIDCGASTGELEQEF